VRPDVVILGEEALKGALLGSHVGAGWSGGFALEDEMHVFVLSVLLGASRFNELWQDAESNEPDGEAREAAQGVGSERCPVVSADPVGKAELAEKSSKDGNYAIDGDIRATVAGKHESGVHILDGERIAELAVTHGELALEVSGPASVGGVGYGIRPTWMPAPDPPSSLRHEIVAEEDVMHGGPRGQRELGPVPLQIPDDLLRPVVVIGTPNLEDGLDDLGWRGPGAAKWLGGAVREPRRAFLLPSVEPCISGLAADPVALANGAEAPETAVHILDETRTFVHDMGLRERHRSPPC
jgi:hypothetical protein